MLRNSWVVWIFLLSFSMSACKDNKTKTCEATWKRIQQCLPQFSENKEMHLKMCRETFDKSSTRGTNRCAAGFTNCEQFKKCLSYGARCRDHEGKEFDNCLAAAPACADYNAAEFKHCIACVQAGQEKTLDKCVQTRVKAARSESDAEEEDSMAAPAPADPMAAPAGMQ